MNNEKSEDKDLHDLPDLVAQEGHEGQQFDGLGFGSCIQALDVLDRLINHAHQVRDQRQQIKRCGHGDDGCCCIHNNVDIRMYRTHATKHVSDTTKKHKEGEENEENQQSPRHRRKMWVVPQRHQNLDRYTEVSSRDAYIVDSHISS